MKTKEHNKSKINGHCINNINDIYKENYKSIYYYILGKVGNKDYIAEELTNDVFIKCKDHLNNYDEHQAKIKTWLFAIAKNHVIDYYRKESNNKNIVMSNFIDIETNKESFQIRDNNLSEDIENNELSVIINNAIEGLKPYLKEIAKLYFIEEKQYNEIAEYLNIPMGTVKGNINRIRGILKEQLKPVMNNV